MDYKPKTSKTNEKKESKFLEFVYADIHKALDRFQDVEPQVREELFRDLVDVVAERVKQSFKNGIEVGMKRGKKKDRPEK